MLGLAASTACAGATSSPSSSERPSNRAPDTDVQPLESVTVFGRSFESYQLGRSGLRFVWIPDASARSTSVQTWVPYQVRTEPLAPPGLPEAAARVLARRVQGDPRALAPRVDLDRFHLNVRTTAAPDRWFVHLKAHADWLCRPQWTGADLQHAVRPPPPPDWTAVAARLGRAAWHARTQQPAVRREGSLTVDDLRFALQAWWSPRRAIVVVAGPGDMQSALTEVATAFASCQVEPSDAPERPLERAVGFRSVKVPGHLSQLLLSWAQPAQTPKDAAASVGIAVALGDPRSTPLAAVVPTSATGIAVRPRRNRSGRELEILMTLAPTVTASSAVARVRAAIAQIAEERVDTSRGRAALRNRTLRRLASTSGSAALAARQLLFGGTLEALAQRLEAQAALTDAQLAAVARGFAQRPPLVLVGQPQDPPPKRRSKKKRRRKKGSRR